MLISVTICHDKIILCGRKVLVCDLESIETLCLNLSNVFNLNYLLVHKQVCKIILLNVEHLYNFVLVFRVPNEFSARCQGSET